MLLPGQPSFSAPPVIVPQWKRVDPAASGLIPLDLNLVKDFIDRPREDTAWDAQISEFIQVAQVAVETLCQMVLVPTAWVGSLPCLYDQIRLFKRPFIDVQKIEYVAPTTGEITTIDAGIYQALPTTQFTGTIFLGDSCVWPTTARRFDAVRVTMRAGFDPLPAEVQHAVLMTVAALDRMRGDAGAGAGGSHVSVYAMKNSRGAQLVPAEARALLSDYILRVL